MGVDQISQFQLNLIILAKFNNPGILGMSRVRAVSQFLRCFLSLSHLHRQMPSSVIANTDQIAVIDVQNHLRPVQVNLMISKGLEMTKKTFFPAFVGCSWASSQFHQPTCFQRDLSRWGPGRGQQLSEVLILILVVDLWNFAILIVLRDLTSSSFWWASCILIFAKARSKWSLCVKLFIGRS